MKTTRFELKGEFDFVGKGKAYDKSRNKTIDVEIRFKTSKMAFTQETLEYCMNGKLETDLIVNDDHNLWEIVAFDNEESKEI